MTLTATVRFVPRCAGALDRAHASFSRELLDLVFVVE